MDLKYTGTRFWKFEVKFESFGKPGILEVENHGC
jgi:hypothetical protein